MKMDITKKRLLILFVCCLMNLCIGSMYAWSVFAVPFAERFTLLLGYTVTAGDLSVVFTVANAIGPVALIFGGAINDKLGARWVCLVSGLVFGVGMVLSGRTTSLTGLIITFSIMAGLSMGFIYSCTVGTCVKYFPDKRGLVGGLSVATYGLSSVIVPLVATPLIETRGIVSTVAILGTAFAAIVCASALVLDKCPDAFVPKGWTPLTGDAGRAACAGKSWKGMLRDPIFYVMISMLIFGAFSGLMIISQASSVAQAMTGMTPQTAAAAVSILALFNTAGRILAGYLSDKIGRINCLAGVFAVAIAGLSILYLNKSGALALFYIGLCIVGICFGAIMGVFPSFTADQFGAKNNSVNYGIMFTGFGLAGFFGPIIMKNIFASSGAYQPAFLIAAVLAALGLGFTFLYRPLAKKA